MSLLLFLFLAVKIYCEEEIRYETFSKTTGNFANNTYLNIHQISTNEFTYSSSESEEGHPISYAFDARNENTYWVSKDTINETVKTFILINFQDTTSLEGFIIDFAYRSRSPVRYYDGAPLEINVYSSINNNPLTLKYFFNGTYDSQLSANWEHVQFPFTTPLECDTLKIEFSKVTLDESFSHKNNSVVKTLTLVSYINESTNIEITGVNGNYADENYVNEHLIPPSYFTFRSSGDNPDYPSSNLFDNVHTTYWVSKDPNRDTFKNYLILDFKGSVSLEGFLYDTAYRTKGSTRNFDGFPTKLKVFASSGGNSFKLIYIFKGMPVYPWTRIQFIFPELVNCDRIKLEFSTVTVDVSFGNELTACSGGLFFIQHISEEYQNTIDEINSIFTDYIQLTLNESITSEKIEELRQKSLKYSNYETELKPIFDRIEAIHQGTIKKDPHREFSTKPGSRNMIEQYGDTAGYCRNTVLFANFGTNRQVIGIGGNTGKPIVVYVDVEPMEGQPKSSVRLPTITFTQIFGSWQSSFRTSNLKLGRNSFIFPDIQTQGYSVPVEKGGPIHVNNPYTYETQRGHATIYIEGGYVYPVFHRGDDEESFKIILQNYYKRLNDPNDTDITVDAFEAVSDHVMTSCSCTLAYNVYIGEGLSAQHNIDNWDEFLGELLAFGGLPFDKNDPKYTQMNDHVRENFRTVQPYAGFFAFACTEMIGLPSSGTHRHCVQLGVPGWAFAHEFGHTVDKRCRTWGENTNNMWAMYNIFFMNGEIYDRLPITAVSQKLASDFSDYVTHKDGTYLMNNNPTVWWILEGAKPGYWADSENFFIYEQSDRNENGQSIIGMTERLVYYASLSFGQNLSTYFERWGFCMDRDGVYNLANRWTYEKSTDNFKNLMNQALENGRINDVYKKYWYVNLDQYWFLYHRDNKLTDDAHCYSLDEYITPISINKNGDSYIILLPEFKCQESHLCYEVQSYINNEWKVVGVTYTQVFADDYDYQGATPRYRVYAYDRFLDHTSDPPDDSSPEEHQLAVCKIGETYYNTLNEAVDASENGDTIILLRSFMLKALTLNKKVTIIPDEGLKEPITITKINSGNLININGIGTGTPNIQIGDNSRVKIIIDGGGFKQTGNLIRIAQTKKLYLYNVELKNSINTNDGGAISVDHNAHVEMVNCIVEKCSSDKNGGGVYLCGGQQNYVHSELHINNVIFRENYAKLDGGAIDASGVYGYSRLMSSSDALFERNTAGRNGGAIYAVKYEEMIGSVFKGNQAQNGGAIYVHSSNFEFKLCSSNFSDNKATVKGSDVYLQSGNLVLNGGKFEGTIHKVTGTTIKFNKFNNNVAAATVPDFIDAIFSLQLPDGGNPLIDIIGEQYTPLIPDKIDTFIVENGFARYENNKIIAYPSQSTITVTFNGKTFSFIVPYGDFILPSTFEGFPEDYSITSWIKDSTTYNVGDKIFVNRDFSFQVTALKYCHIKIVYHDKEQIIKIVPNTYYYMPMTTPDDEIVFGWECSDGNYYAYADPVLITTDLTFTAVLMKKVVVTIQIGNNVETYKLNYNEFFIIPEPPETLDGLTFKYFYSENDYKYQPGDKITILNDIKISAFYSNTISVVYISGESKETKEYQQNEEIILHHPGPENPEKPNNGREFIYWEINKAKYYPFYKYTITKNVQATASYGLLNKNTPITVSYQIPNVLPEYPHFVNGTVTRTETFSYLDNITLHGEEYFLNEPYGLGYDRNTSRENLFDYWLINGMRYNGSETFGVTEGFTAVLVTKLSTKGLPPETPTPTPPETPTQSALPTFTPLASETPTPEPTPIKTDPEISDINRDKNLVTMNLDCKIMNGNIKINLKCSTCLITEYMWFTIFFENGEIDYDNIQYDDRNMFQIGDNFYKLDYFVNKLLIEYNEKTNQLKFDTGSQYIILMDGQAVNNLKCYPPPTSTPRPTETPSKSPTPAPTPIYDFSNLELTGKMSTIILDELYLNSKIEKTKFTDITLENDDCEYMIIVRKEMQFNDVHFIFTNTHIGAIKIEFGGEVTISNCVFTGCSVINGNGNAILIAENSESTSKIIQNCEFNSCGNKGYAVSASQAVEIRNSDVTFDDTSSCGGFKIQKCGTTITNCNLINNQAKGAIFYNPIGTTPDTPFIIDQCTIENCKGVGFYSSIPTLSPDQIAIRQSLFINCVNTEITGANAISFNEIADSFSLDVRNCLFKNCGTNGFIFSLSAMRVKEDFLESLISFTNVIFEFDTEKTASGIEVSQADRKVAFNNCTFKQIRQNDETEEMVSAIYAPTLSSVIIEQSIFYDCSGTVVYVDEQNAEILVQNSTFDSCGSPLSVKKESITLLRNNFINSNSIEIQTKILDAYQFKLIENHFTRFSSGPLINIIDGFQTKPIIERNVFENINVNSELFSFIITLDSSSIEFENNTFRDVTTQYGGFGGRIGYSETQNEASIIITFSRCYFLDSTQNSQGGAFRACELQNNRNAKVSFNNCHFENNKAKSFGGALYIDFKLDTTINSCTFISNMGGDGQGAAIFIASNDASILITDCHFKDNADFEDDKLDGFAIRSQATSFDISNCVFEYTDINTAISGLQVESTSSSVNVNNCSFIKCSGAESTSFIIECQNSIQFTNNNIDSCKYDSNLGKIYILGDSTEQTIKSCHFTNNIKVSSSTNSGLLIQKQSAGDIQVIYESCEFKSNSASAGSGGAISITTEDAEKTVSITMKQCKFSNNNADLNGGALLISSATSISIIESDFIDNLCSKRGGALYIEYEHIKSEPARFVKDTAYCSITSCKFERNKASDYGNAIFVNEIRENTQYEIQNNQFIDNYFEESNPGYVIVASYYAINVEQNTFNNQNVPVNKFFLLSTVPSQSPSQSPTASPQPTMTVIPGSNDNYINKEYIKTIPPCESTNNQIQAVEGSNVNQISGCRFININYQDKNYFIKITKEIPFFDNYFEYADPKPNNDPAPIWADQLPKITLTRCTFINAVTKKENDANVFSCTNANTYITIESCLFRNCGKSADQFIIRLPKDKSAIKIMKSTIEFTDLSKSCKVISEMNNAHYVVINGSTFNGCAQNAFEFSICSENGFVPTEPFQFNDNVVKNQKGQFLNGANLINKPIIIGNTFQDIQLNGQFLISLSHNSPDIEISKTSFINIQTSGNNYGGGIAISLPSTVSDLSEITITFNKCQFINNEAFQGSSSITDGHYNGDGGAIHYGYESPIINSNMKFINCTFNQNKAYRNGGAISLQTAGSVLIQNCIFEENVANNKGVASADLLYENHYSKKSYGVGGAIYINPTFNTNGQDYHMTNITIIGCVFIKNKAFNGYAIYIEGEDLDIPITIFGNEFINNFNEDNSPEKGSVIASEIMTLDKEEIEKSNEYTNNELATGAGKIEFVNNNGMPIAETPAQPTPTSSPLPTIPSYDAGIIENVVNGKNNYMKFDCPVQDGSIKIYTNCSSCDKINNGQEAWFIVYFENGNMTNVEHEDKLIHGDTHMSAFVPINKINYASDTYTLTYFLDSTNMFYVRSELNLICNVPPMTAKATPTPPATPTSSPLPTIPSYDAGIIENVVNGKNNYMKFDCPVQDGSIKIYTNCSSCDKINNGQEAWFIVYFENGNMTNVEHEDKLIHGNTHMSAFVPINKINYASDTYTLTYFLDSTNMFYVRSELNLICNVPPMTAKATPTPPASPTKSPTPSPPASPTKSPTPTPPASPTKSPTPTPPATPTKSPTPSPPASPTKSPTPTPPATPTKSPTPSPPATPTKSPTPSPPASPTKSPYPESYIEDLVLDNTNYTENQEVTRVQKIIEGNDKWSVRITLIANEFRGNNNNYGGAVHLINCGLNCQQTHFIECISNEGGGGAIYIKNYEKLLNDVVLQHLVISKCQSQYGGGIYIYSSSYQNLISITDCQFDHNVATLSSAENGLFGGSSIFFTAKKGNVKSCTFLNDEGPSSLKIYNKFNTNTKSLLSEGLFTVTDCKFEIGSNSKCSIFYEGGNGGAKFDLKNCIFTGKINENAHFIDGKITGKNSPKMRFKNCKFSCSFERVLNESPDNKFFSINLKDQVFEYNKSNENGKSFKGNWKLTTLIVEAAASVVILTIVLVVYIRKKNINDYSSVLNDQNEVETPFNNSTSADSAALNSPLDVI